MQPVSIFRGSSGEVVSEFVSPMTYAAALPVVLGVLILGWICDHLGGFRTYVSMPILYIFVSMATMRIALPASRGDIEPTNEPGEIITYTGRYLLLNLVWFIPWTILWKWLTKGAAFDVSALFMNPVVLMQSSWLLLIRVILVIIALLLPMLCLLVTLHSISTKGLFRGLSWSWLLNQRRADLATFMSSLIGGSLVMVLCSLVPALILIRLGFKHSSQTGMFIAGILYPWIVSTILVLNGRLAGVFVAHDVVQIDFVADEPLIASTDADSAPQAIVRPMEPKPDLSEIERRITAITKDELSDALHAASELETSLTAPIRGQIEQMLLSLRSNNADWARNFAALAIDSAAQRGFTDICMKLFEIMGGERRKLKLAAYSLEVLGNMYQQKKQLLDAAWCLHAAANAAGDTIKAQKRLFQIAEMAEKASRHADALTLYEILIKQYPDSTLAEFAQQGAARSKNLM